MAGRPRRLACTPYDSDTRPLWATAFQARRHRTPGLFCWPGRADANKALDVGEPGFIRRPRVPDHAGSNSAIQTDGRKGKPTGDGTRPEPGRAMSLEGSTPSPSAERSARGRAAEASVFQTGQAGSTPAGHSADRCRSATDCSLTRRRTTWPGRQPADHPSSELGMLGVQLPPGPLNDALADQPGVVATPSPWRAWVQIPSRVL
jgi:hypothetical protein